MDILPNSQNFTAASTISQISDTFINFIIEFHELLYFLSNLFNFIIETRLLILVTIVTVLLHFSEFHNKIF